MSKKQRIAELERRVAELEQTVFVLQAKVGVLERSKTPYRWPVVPPDWDLPCKRYYWDVGSAGTSPMRIDNIVLCANSKGV